MAYPNTGSILEASGGKNRTGISVSTEIVIKVDGNSIGAIQNIDLNEDRSIYMLDEVGTDGHVDSVPKSSTNVSLSCERIRFDNLRVAAAFSRGFVHVHSQRRPFNIEVVDMFAGEDPSTWITTVVKNCWIKKISFAHKVSDYTISERMDIEAETIFSFLGANNNVVPGAAGGRNLAIGLADPYELSADKGGRRGALDAAGLLLAIESA